MKTLTKFQMVLLVGILSLGAIFWHVVRTVPALSHLDYLGNQFYVFWHEAGHALLAVVTGGSVHEMMVVYGLGGHVLHSGGWYWLISPAGYFIPALLGCGLLVLALKRPQFGDLYAFLLGVTSMLVAAFFTTTNPTLRAVALLGVGTNIFWFSVKAKQWRLVGSVIAVLICGGIAWYISGLQEYLRDSANLVFLIGIAAGGLLMITGSSGKIFLSLIVLMTFDVALLYNAITRAGQIIEATRLGLDNDALFYSQVYGVNPLFTANLWVSLITIMYVVTSLIVVNHIIRRK